MRARPASPSIEVRSVGSSRRLLLLAVELSLIRALLRVKKLVMLLGFCLPWHFPSRRIAETAGIISGTVTDDRTHAPVAGVAVVAKSPSATYRTVTDSRGHVPFFERAARQLFVVVFSDRLRAVFDARRRSQRFPADGQRSDIDVASRRSRSTHARSAGSAFQRGMTIDTYTVTGQQITMVQGKEFNTDQNQLLRSIPSVTIDKIRNGIDSRRFCV